jgi:hypothetical protein
MAIAPLNKFITIAVPVAPGEQTVYTAPTGVSSIVLYASVSNVGIGGTYPKVTFTHRRTSTASKTSGNVRNTRVVKNAEIPPEDSLVVIDGRLVLERSALLRDSVVISGVQTGITTITNVGYSSITGIATVTTYNAHGFNVNDEVTMSGIAFTCGGYSGSITTSIFPEPQRGFTVDSIIGNVGTSKTFVIDAGKVNIPHTYLPAIHSFQSAVTNSVTVVSGSGGPFTPTNATYDGATGVLVLTIANHGLSNGNTISIADYGLTFRCSMDNYLTDHPYPRPTDPASTSNSQLNNGVLTISNATTNTFEVNVGVSPSGGRVGPLQMELIMSILENSTT